MKPNQISDAIAQLLDLDGIESVEVKVTLTPTIRLRNTGEVDEVFNEIRERSVSEEELEGFAVGTPWRYHGTIDVPGDYHVRDRFSLFETVEQLE